MPSEEKRKEASFPKVWRDKGSWEIYFTILFWFGMGYITTSLPFPTNTAPFQTQLSENGAFRFLTTRPLLAKGPKIRHTLWPFEISLQNARPLVSYIHQ